MQSGHEALPWAGVQGVCKTEGKHIEKCRVRLWHERTLSDKSKQLALIEQVTGLGGNSESHT